MTGSRWRWVALFVVLTLFFSPQSDAAKRRRKARGKRAAPAVPMDSASGATLQERLNSLVNGNVSRISDTSIQIVEVDSGTVVAERNPHVPLAPASNMKLFTTAAAID